MDLALKLTELGLNEKETKTYLAALELGPSSIFEISKKSKVNRGTTYYIVEELLEQALLVKTKEKQKVLYAAADPASLKNLIKQKEMLLDSIMPELAALNSRSVKRPKISFYEGENSFKIGVLDFLEAKDEILTFSSALGFKVMLDLVPEAIKTRVKKGIFNKVIGVEDPLFTNQQRFDKERLREMRLMPPNKYSYNDLIYIYNNKVNIISYKDKVALIIESPDIADSWRSIFYFCWDVLGEKKKIENAK